MCSFAEEPKTLWMKTVQYNCNLSCVIITAYTYRNTRYVDISWIFFLNLSHFVPLFGNKQYASLHFISCCFLILSYCPHLEHNIAKGDSCLTLPLYAKELPVGRAWLPPVQRTHLLLEWNHKAPMYHITHSQERDNLNLGKGLLCREAGNKVGHNEKLRFSH